MNPLSKLIAVFLTLTPVSGYSHKAWMLPSTTVLASNQWISVDAAVSNDLFYFNHAPLKLDNLHITGPNALPVQAENPFTGKYRNGFDLHLIVDGTYKLSIVNDVLFASYELNGEKKRWRGNADALESDIPETATNLEVNRSLSRVDTFVTAGAPNDLALKPAGKGLELVAVTHPNDLYVGEAARFRFQLDGKWCANLKVSIVPGGSRYRDTQDLIELVTDKDGQFTVTWPKAGMYWLETTHADDQAGVAQAKQRRLTYSATLEVLPQ